MAAWLLLLKNILGGIVGVQCAFQHTQEYTGLLSPQTTGTSAGHFIAPTLLEQPSSQIELNVDSDPSNLNVFTKTSTSINEGDERSPAIENCTIQPPIDPTSSSNPEKSILVADLLKADSRNQAAGQTNQETRDCRICLEEIVIEAPLQAVLLLDCIHWFHYHCVETWLKTDDRTSCPICRVSTGDNPVVIDLYTGFPVLLHTDQTAPNTEYWIPELQNAEQPVLNANLPETGQTASLEVDQRAAYINRLQNTFFDFLKHLRKFFGDIRSLGSAKIESILSCGFGFLVLIFFAALIGTAIVVDHMARHHA